MDRGNCFECASCTYLVKNEGSGTPTWCPMCRGALEPVESPSSVEWSEPHVCDDCGARFRSLAQAKEPYKCIQCNFSLKPNPHKRGDERL